MSEIYDRWEKLVRATLRREQLRLTAERTPSDLSLASSSSTSWRISCFGFNFSSLSFVGDTFDYNLILQATNHLSKSNLIKRGRSGDFFHGVLEGGTEIVIKQIDLSSANKDSYLKTELEVFDKVYDHPRMVPLLGYCFLNPDDNFKYLVYKYMPHKDLSTASFSEFIYNWSEWVKRLKIAVGVAEALCYLHHECVPPLVHGDVQASSILLDDNFEVRLGSLSNVRAHKPDGISSSNRLMLLQQELEQSTSGSGLPNATCSDDVFCFGKLLLDLITGNTGFLSLTDLLTLDINMISVEKIARDCLLRNPSGRPAIIQILKRLRTSLALAP